MFVQNSTPEVNIFYIVAPTLQSFNPNVVPDGCEAHLVDRLLSRKLKRLSVSLRLS